MLIPSRPSSIPGSPLKTRVASFLWHNMGRCLSRRMILTDLEKIHARLPEAARAKFLEVIGEAKNGIIQELDLPRLCDASEKLVFERVGERNLCKSMDSPRLENLVAKFGEVEGIRLKIIDGKALEILRETPPPAPATAEEPRVAYSDVAPQLKFLREELQSANFPLGIGEIRSRAKAKGFSKKARGRLPYHLTHLSAKGEVIMTIDERYMWADREAGPLQAALESGRISELYSEDQQKEYVSSRGEEEFSRKKDNAERIVRIQVGNALLWTRFTYADQLKAKGEAKRVYFYDAAKNAKAIRYILTPGMDRLLQQGEIIPARGPGKKEIFVLAGDRKHFAPEIYNYWASIITQNLHSQGMLKPNEAENFTKSLDRIFSFAWGVLNEEVFPLLDRALTAAKIGATSVEVMASLLTPISRSHLRRFLLASSPGKNISESYRDIIISTIENFHLLRQVAFCKEEDNPRHVQWNKRLFLKQLAAKVPVLKLLFADALERIKRGGKVDEAKLEFIYLYILDQTVEIRAAAALKDALLWRDLPEKAREILSRARALYNVNSYEQLDAILIHFTKRLEKELRTKFGDGILATISRTKSLASIYDKIDVCGIYDNIEELWDIWGIQVIVESDLQAAQVAQYLAKGYGVKHKIFDQTGQAEKLSPEGCSPDKLRKKSDVTGKFGEGVEFYKIRVLFPSSHGPSRKAEIQVHTKGGFRSYKQGVAGTANYNQQKKHPGLEFEPEATVDPTLPFEEQIRGMVKGMDQRECWLRVGKETFVRSVPPGTKVLELAADPALQKERESFLARGYGHAEVHRYSLTDEWELQLIPALTDPKERILKRAFDAIADPDYEVQDRDIITFVPADKRDPAAERGLASLMIDKVVNPNARLELKKLLDTEAQFEAAIAQGRTILQKYFQQPRDRLWELQQIAKRQNFIAPQDFFAAVGYGFIQRHDVETELKRYDINITPGADPGGINTLEVYSPDALGLLGYLMEQAIPKGKILGGFSYTTRDHTGARAEVFFQVAGEVRLQQNAYRDLNRFIHTEGTAAFNPEATLYIIDLRRKGENWDGFRQFISFLSNLDLDHLVKDLKGKDGKKEKAKVNPFEFDLPEDKSIGYIKVELPAGLSGAKFTAILAESEFKTEEIGAVLI